MSSKLRLLASLKYLLPTDTIIKIYKAILLPTMLYNCTTNVNFSRTQLSMLSLLDNRIEKLCTKKQPPIVNEIKRHTAMLVKKCMLGEVCDNMNGMFVVKQHGITTRNNGYKLETPLVKLNLTKSLFRSMGVTIYNNLLIEYRKINSLLHFKKDITVYFSKN